MKIAIIYESLGGNTEELAKLIANEFEQKGAEVDLFFASRLSANLSIYDITFFGSYTWGDGELPKRMRKCLRRILIDSPNKPKAAAVFGTGDTQYHFFCRAVDEMAYHLTKHGVDIIGEGLKIEQFCQGRQVETMKNWTNEIWGAIV
nr:putative flavodoxin-2 [Bacillaceae bacterium]